MDELYQWENFRSCWSLFQRTVGRCFQLWSFWCSNRTFYHLACRYSILIHSLQAVGAAKEAFNTWGFQTTAKERGAILNRWFQILIEKQDSLAELLTREQGKPLAEAKGEIQYSAGFLDWYAGEARRIYGEIVQPPVLNRQHFHTREPIGVVAIITPVRPLLSYFTLIDHLLVNLHVNWSFPVEFPICNDSTQGSSSHRRWLYSRH